MRVVADGVSPAQLRAMLLLRRSDAEQALVAEAERLRQIEARIAQLDTDDSGVDDVRIRAEPAHQVLIPLAPCASAACDPAATRTQ